jgi:tetratricopeptide (TPR) repeat protein
MSERGFFGELLHRRVFQYLGLYIASVWLAIEMGDWLSEQFTMPERLTTYIFVFMAVLLPSVALVAWGHGAPGKDGTSKTELAFVPLNILLAAACVFLVPDRAPMPEIATADAGASGTYGTSTAVVAERAALPSMQRVLAYFLPNKTTEAPDWFAYAISILVAEDLQRESTAFSVVTPFDDDSLVDAMRQAGFDNALSVPQALQLKLARQRRYGYMMRGEFADSDDGRYVVRYTLHDVATGEPRVSGEEVFGESGFFAAIDRISAAVRDELETRLPPDIQMTDLPVSESMSTSLEALQLYTEARVTANLDQDAQRAGELMKQAVGVDPQFAEAHGALGVFYYFQARNDLAEASFEEALRYGFRLSRASEFIVKTNKAAIGGDLLGARDLARAWVRIEPGNVSAYLRLAELNRLANLDLDEALRAYETVRQLNPMAINTYQWSAAVEQQRGNPDEAKALLLKYAEAAPDDVGGLMQLAQLQASLGDFDDALASYRQAGLLDDRALAPKLGAIRVFMRRGDYATAEERLQQLQARELTDEERLQVVTTAVTLYLQRGQYEAGIAQIAEVEPLLERIGGQLLLVLQARAPRLQSRGFLLEDPAPVLAELDALAATMQPPWNDFISIYKAGLLAAHDDAEGFLEIMPLIERVAAAQPSNGNLQFMIDNYRALAALYRGESENSVALARSALERSRSSFLAVEQSEGTLQFQADMYDTMRRAGEVAEAATGLEAIVATYPGLAIAQLHLAQAYLDLNRERQARQALDNVKTIWQEADESLIYLQTVAQVESELEERA